ncbi:adenosylcobinamide amidohydrolase [Lysinibacillus telephonicus]|uniref:ATP-binding cassette domain-containing protein n=1 Tax=Lysinibacillus telephonicus TaxID=1714840 RepID=A0A3S0J4Y0_9BACI|nr:adenosylcobinamide amidohydrolase [Lysinibacillus telephonicus]RTQ94968.1 ATP-binding cassette domain-containing protein [Lysinibacillus telephonicus]
MLKANNISGGYDTTPILKNISFSVSKGKFLGILGPNGCGKSTLLKIISGLLKPTSGNVLIDEVDINKYTSRQLAQKMTVLPQLHTAAFSSTVRETVSIGRYPHQSGFFSSWSNEDEHSVMKAMEQTAVKKFEHTFIEYLSGGEKQRVFIAQALAQSSDLLLLDEPTNHLDIAHQKQILDMIRKEVTDNGLTVVSVFHDINLASLYCDELLLMEKGTVRAFGEPHEVLIEHQIKDVYEARISLQAHPEQPKPQMTILPDVKKEASEKKVLRDHIKIKEEYVELKLNFPLRVLSSAVHNAGLGWYSNFINRTVKADYNIDKVKEEFLQYLLDEGFSPTNTVGMMTAVDTKNAVIKQYNASFGDVFVIVTAGIGNAIDVSQAYKHEDSLHIGTINTWVVINGKLSDEAFVQAMMTATEAKTKALQQEKVYDFRSNSIATSTPTDSLLVAATQQGPLMQYGGPITDVGKVIGRGVFEATKEAIQIYRKGD